MASHIPGANNVEADFASDHFTDDMEWALSKLIFLAVCKNWFSLSLSRMLAGAR